MTTRIDIFGDAAQARVQLKAACDAGRDARLITSNRLVVSVHIAGQPTSFAFNGAGSVVIDPDQSETVQDCSTVGD